MNFLNIVIKYLNSHEDLRDSLMLTSGGINLLGVFNSLFAWIEMSQWFTVAERLVMVLGAASVTAITVYSKWKDEQRKAAQAEIEMRLTQERFDRENKQDEERHNEEMKHLRERDDKDSDEPHERPQPRTPDRIK